MSIAKECIDALREGNLNLLRIRVMELVRKYKEIYNNVKSIWGGDELIPIIAHELVHTDIEKDDLTRIHILERKINFGEIDLGFSNEEKYALSLLISTGAVAVGVKTIENYSDYLVEEVNEDNILKFSEESFSFSQLTGENSCIEKTSELLNEYFVNLSTEEAVTGLFNEMQSTHPEDPFITAVQEEVDVQIKVTHLNALCDSYLSYLEKIIKDHIKEKNQKLFNNMFSSPEEEEGNNIEMKEKASISLSEALTNLNEKDNTDLNTLKNDDFCFKLACNKYDTVKEMKDILNDDKKPSAKKLSDFKHTFNANRDLLNKRRDNAGTTFLKGVATVLSLGFVLLLYKNFWKPESQKTAEQIDLVLRPKL
ncbi:hypothetical protein E3983_11650 [Legionella israelensis]|uniref:Lpg0393-like VPS9-like domain-containing protein n=1 Tax=Legionella israelensis TaxID=454 RepID=A0AAX1EIM7_9GAMM|nr:hypothetical protein [Legionella israelensis]QBR84947.1 hypothetical protein E3983_11650 [Legionella israelensis]